MDRVILAIAVMAVYRMATLLVGCIIVYMGYRLYQSGLFPASGDLKAIWGEKKLILRQATPGTFFVLFGTVIIGVSLWKGIEVTEGTRSVREGAANPISTPTSSDLPEGASSIIEVGGALGRPELLSVQIRRELSDYALCQLSAGGQRAQEVACVDSMAITLPFGLVDLKSIENLESQQTAESQEALANMRNQFVRHAQR